MYTSGAAGSRDDVMTRETLALCAICWFPTERVYNVDLWWLVVSPNKPLNSRGTGHMRRHEAHVISQCQYNSRISSRVCSARAGNWPIVSCRTSNFTPNASVQVFKRTLHSSVLKKDLFIWHCTLKCNSINADVHFNSHNISHIGMTHFAI